MRNISAIIAPIDVLLSLYWEEL